MRAPYRQAPELSASFWCQESVRHLLRDRKRLN